MTKLAGSLDCELNSLNIIEHREWLNDNADAGNTNMCAISKYKGPITAAILKSSLQILIDIHPMLRVSIKAIEQTPMFFPATPFIIPLKEYAYKDQMQWKEIAKKYMRQKFKNENEPFWKVIFLKGIGEGMIFLIFQHSIADGISVAQLMNQLYQIISAKMLGEQPIINSDLSFPPSLENLFQTVKQDEMELHSPSTTDQPKGVTNYHTSYEIKAIDRNSTLKIIQFCQKHKIKVHSAIYAAFLKAVKIIKNPDFNEFEALTVVSLRPYFQPPALPDLLRSLFTWVSGKFSVTKEMDIFKLAVEIHHDLHRKLDDGLHILNLKSVAEQLESNPTPQEFLSKKMPPNLLCLTNLGVLPFDGTYPCQTLQMEELFFLANSNNYFEHEHNACLCASTFRGQLNLSLFFLEELIEESVAQAILQEIAKNLERLVKEIV